MAGPRTTRDARPGPRRAGPAVIVLAAGKGTRMPGWSEPGAGPKVLLDCLGAPLIDHVRRAVSALEPSVVVVVTGHRREALEAWLAGSWPDAVPRVQQPQNGTGHAARLALEAIPDFRGDVVVAYGDVPQLTGDDLRGLLDAHRKAGAAATVLTGTMPDPGALGRVLRGPDGRFQGIVEQRDASPAQLLTREFNTGIYAFLGDELRAAVAGLSARNAQGEEYLTDAVGALAAGGGATAVPARDGAALLGVNTPADLAAAAALVRRRIVAEHVARGVLIVDPLTTWVEVDVEIAPGARILPFTYLGHGCRIGPRCVVGPFAHLRGGTVLEAGAQIGNFVEVKASRLGEGAKAKHLTYLGDADVGAGANVGCGTITANYDGKRKHRTTIGARARIGSGTVLVAPVTVGEGAVTGANAVVLAGRDVVPGAAGAGVPAREVRRGGGASPRTPAPPATRGKATRKKSAKRRRGDS